MGEEGRAQGMSKGVEEGATGSYASILPSTHLLHHNHTEHCQHPLGFRDAGVQK